MKKNIYFLFFYILIFFSQTYALFEYKEIFANSGGLCGAFSAEEENLSVIYYNPAGIFNIPKYSFYFSNTNLYNISQLANNTFCFSTQIKSLGNIGFMYNNFGFELYKENLIYFTYSNNVKEKFSFGINVKSLYVDIKNYGNKSFLSFDVGVLAKPHYKFLASFVVRNINSTNIAEDEVVPKELVVGSKIQFVKNVLSYVDVIKNPEDPVFFRIGEEIRYNLNDQFLSIFRAGLETATEYKPAKYSLGFGLSYKIKDYEINIDYSYLHHLVLSGQHLFSLGLNFAKPQKVYYEEEPQTKKTKKVTTQKEIQYRRQIKEKLPSKPINLNTATKEEIANLPGIGPSTAQKIVEYRQQIGRFTSLEQLLEVPRVGSLTLQRIKQYVVLEEKVSPIEKEESEKQVEQQKSQQVQEVVEEKKQKQQEDLKQQENKEQKVIKQEEVSYKKYNINTITEEELKTLGFSFSEAKNIIRYRTRFGKFSSVEELYKIPNINKKNIDRVKSLLYVE